MSVSYDGNHLIIGGFSCKVYVLELSSLELEYVYEPCESSIRALHISNDNRLVLLWVHLSPTNAPPNLPRKTSVSCIVHVDA